MTMERKIGEMFEHNGEWYQCVEFPFSESEYYCDGCSISAAECVDFTCDPGAREDNERVIFKKLEKVGEPYFNGQYGKVLQEYKYYIPPITPDLRIHIIKLGIVGIEIKQNKEDMGEKKQKLDKLVKDYSYNRIPYEVFDNCLKQLYVDKQIGENNPSLKEFDLKAAKAGKPVCTRDGRKARIICFDFLSIDNTPIIALVRLSETQEGIVCYKKDGRFLDSGDSPHDLMMKGEWE